MEKKDVRWRQRFENLQKAFEHLDKAVKQPELNELEKQGLIKAFEFTYELAWTTLKDFLTEKGYSELIGSKDTIRQAFQVGLIADGDTWMEMVKSRNLTSHTYNQETADSVEQDIITHYHPLFVALISKMNEFK